MKIGLNKRDRICFLGDSITTNSLWIAEIFEYFLKNYHELKIGFYNCGIPGSKGFEVDLHNRLYCDCFNFFPKYVAVMFAMNDVFPGLYSPNCTQPDKVKIREEKLKIYESTIKHIIESCQKEGVTPILCSPTPYDEYSDIEQENCMADCALKHCHDVTQKLANEYNLVFVDMRKMLLEHIDSKPIDIDRVHPNAYGQHLMAEMFLQAIGAKEKTEPDKKCVLSARNKERYDIEQIIRSIEFVERVHMGWQYEEKLPEIKDRKVLLQEKCKSDDSSWIESIRSAYINNADDREELLGKLIKMTSEIYDY